HRVDGVQAFAAAADRTDGLVEVDRLVRAVALGHAHPQRGGGWGEDEGGRGGRGGGYADDGIGHDGFGRGVGGGVHGWTPVHGARFATLPSRATHGGTQRRRRTAHRSGQAPAGWSGSDGRGRRGRAGRAASAPAAQ